MDEQWKRIEQRLSELGCLDDMGLGDGADAATLASLEQTLGIALPSDLKRFLSIHDGQARGAALFHGQQFLSCADIRDSWEMWREIDEDGVMNDDCAEFMASEPEGVIKPMYCNRGWIPLTHDIGGNHIGLDFDPDSLGHVGQVIAFGRDEDTKRLLAPNFTAFVDDYVAWLAGASWNGEYLDNALVRGG